MTSLFEPTRAGDLQLANRIAMAPLTRNRSPEAIPTDLVATYYAQRGLMAVASEMMRPALARCA